MQEIKNPDRPKVSLGNKIAFACGDVFGGGSFNIINFLFVPFLTLTVGIPMYWVGVIMLVSKIWDGIIDPFIGNISDAKQPKKYGKRRFFMLICAPLLIVAMVLLFFPWSLVTNSVALKVLLTILVYLIYATTQSFILIPYYSLGSEMSADFVERTNVNAVRLGFSIFSSVICVAVPGMIAGPEKGPLSYIVMAAIFGGVFCIAVLVTALFAREQIVSPAVKNKVNFKRFFEPLKMSTYRNYLGMQMCSSMGMAIMSSYFFTYCDFWLREGTYMNSLVNGAARFPVATVAAAIMFAAQIVALPLYFAIIKNKGKSFAYRTGAGIWAAIALVLFFLPQQQFDPATFQVTKQAPDWLLFVLAFAIGIGIGGPVLVPHTAFGDVCDAGELYYGARREGAFSGLSNFLNTTAQALGLAVASWVIGAAGYLETTYTAPTKHAEYYFEKIYEGIGKSTWVPTSQPDSANLAIRIVIAFLPILIMALGVFFSFKYKLTRERQNRIAACVKLDKHSEEYAKTRQQLLQELDEKVIELEFDGQQDKN
mgnify:FL=1